MEDRMLHVRNWDKWQSYRSDRNQPPWIKLHRRLMHDPSWVLLTDWERGQLVSIWMLAAERNGFIPDDPYLVKYLCHMWDEPDLKTFLRLEFLEEIDTSTVTPTVTPSLAPNMTPQTRLDKTRKEEEPGARAPFAFVGRVISLTQEDYNQWVLSFPNVDLRPYLEARDIFLFDLPEDDNRRKKWMMATASDLRNKNAFRKEGNMKPMGKQLSGKLPIFPRETPRAPMTDEEKAAREKQIEKYLKWRPIGGKNVTTSS